MAATSGWFIAATSCRPDNGLFWIAGGITLLWDVLPRGPSGRPSMRLSREAWIKLGLYAATFLPYALYLAWKVHYYGDVFPNTYYAKSAYLPYVRQGNIYALSFLLGAHLWIVIPVAVLGFIGRATSREHRLLKAFALVALLLFNVYVIRVGGDFMYGRFYLVTMPLWLLLARRAVSRWETGPLWKGAVITCALAATLGGVRLLESPDHNKKWYLGDESGNYSVKHWFPRVEIHHHNWRAGTTLRETMKSRGIEPVMVTWRERP